MVIIAFKSNQLNGLCQGGTTFRSPADSPIPRRARRPARRAGHVPRLQPWPPRGRRRKRGRPFGPQAPPIVLPPRLLPLPARRAFSGAAAHPFAAAYLPPASEAALLWEPGPGTGDRTQLGLKGPV